jgi:hypothetical protein
MTARTRDLGATLALVLGSPAEAVRLCRAARNPRDVALTALGLLLVGSGAFGALLGWTRGPLQALYSGAKLPLAWLLTLAVCAPAYYALASASGAALRFRTVCTVILLATGRASAVLLGLLPLLWIALSLGSDRHGSGLVSDTAYHRFIALAVALYIGSGLAALGVMGELLRKRPLLLLVCSAVFLLAGGQAAWTLRPFVGRPADTELPFVRPAEETFLEVLPRTLRSAGGSYERTAPHRSRCHDPHRDGAECGGGTP